MVRNCFIALIILLSLSGGVEAQDTITTGFFRIGSVLPPTCVIGDFHLVTPGDGFWKCITPNNWERIYLATRIPKDTFIFILSDTCPLYTVEAKELNGMILLGTISANKNVGTSGGNIINVPGGLLESIRVIFCKGI